MQTPSSTSDRHPYLPTARQRQIIDAIDRGLDGEQIAEELGITENTVRQHTKRLVARFQCRVVDIPDRARRAGVAFGPIQE